MEIFIIGLLIALSSGYLFLTVRKKLLMKSAVVPHAHDHDSCQGCDGHCGCKTK